MIRRSHPGDADWIRRTAADVYAPLGDYGKIIPAWMGHAGVMTFLEVARSETDEREARRGFILVGFYEPSEGPPGRLCADLLAIAVAPDHQRQGVGTSLLGYAIDLATQAAREKLPVTEIRLTVADTNTPARALFERHGFEILDAHHGSYDGGQRAIRMRRRVP